MLLHWKTCETEFFDGMFSLDFFRKIRLEFLQSIKIVLSFLVRQEVFKIIIYLLWVHVNSVKAHFKEGEVDRLINLINERLPTGDNEWQLVADDYNTNRPREFPERERDSLQNKFKT